MATLGWIILGIVIGAVVVYGLIVLTFAGMRW